ncbi:hypothetical protein [Goodfellowiella coeruleoviolacea]|uniref:Uncharacterized protein n=1 Tax=Goodfellowiella coeruleoviolacea TaxID=334858 RepID=A0AAE3KI80_9PSEU|nr:hypothetical protein [Goodfellowiella coeruleoviolacea]MCP2168996.1 hypothetical protein [Goodfellowiella coeruleoviolacea]
MGEQQSITIPPQVGRRARPGSVDGVNGVNGYPDNPDHGADVAGAGPRPLPGIAGQTFLLAFQLAAVNPRKQQVCFRTHQQNGGVAGRHRTRRRNALPFPAYRP